VEVTVEVTRIISIVKYSVEITKMCGRNKGGERSNWNGGNVKLTEMI